MTNINCLQGLKCPKCGNEDRLLITASVMADVTDDGADIASGFDMFWDDYSATQCYDCDNSGLLRDFYISRKLPADPEGMNDDRAHWAFVALAAFMAETGTELDDAMADLLCDLMHWCDRNGSSFADQLDRAKWHYSAETSDVEPECLTSN